MHATHQVGMWWRAMIIPFRISVFFLLQWEVQMSQSGFSVKLLMVRETNSMVGYHSIAEGHLIQLGFWQIQGSTLVGVRIFEKFLNIGLNVWKAKNRYILSLRMEQNGANSYIQYIQWYPIGCFPHRWLLLDKRKLVPKKLKNNFFLDKLYSLKVHAHYFTVLIYLATWRAANLGIFIYSFYVHKLTPT